MDKEINKWVRILKWFGVKIEYIKSKYQILTEELIKELEVIFNDPYRFHGDRKNKINKVTFEFKTDTYTTTEERIEHRLMTLFIKEDGKDVGSIYVRTYDMSEEETYHQFYIRVFRHILLAEDSEFDRSDGTKGMIKSMKTLYNGK